MRTFAQEGFPDVGGPDDKIFDDGKTLVNGKNVDIELSE
jgi:hypothetical protein